MKTIICFLALTTLVVSALAQQHYSTLGRDPMIPGGVSWQKATDRGWEPYRLPADAHLKMRGAKGEWVDAFLPKGTEMAWCPDGSERILACGNITNRVRVVQTKTQKTDSPILTIYREDQVGLPNPPVADSLESRVRPPQYMVVYVLSPQTQYIGMLAAPTVVSPVIGGIGSGFGGNRINIRTNAYGAAAAAAAAAASTSSTSATPTSAAGTSGGSSSGSSGSAGGGGSGSGSGSH